MPTFQIAIFLPQLFGLALFDPFDIENDLFC